MSSNCATYFFRFTKMVKNNANLYLCQIPSWCSGAAGNYEPGVGAYWQQAWVLAGICPNGSSKMIVNNQKTLTELAYLYPNPTLDEVNIVLPNAPIGQIQLYIFDLNGKNIFLENIDNQENTLLKKINLIDFPTGIYNVKIVTKDWNETWRISKM